MAADPPPSATAGSKPPPPSRLHRFLYSGSRRDVMVGLVVVTALITIPWIALGSGSSGDRHKLDDAERARQARLSTTK